MHSSRLQFLFMNIGHFLDHYFVLIFATAALRLSSDWGLSYAELILYGTPGFIAFGLGAIPAGWFADKWSREGMMVVFFLGIGACSMLTSMVATPTAMAVSLTLVGLFAAIYHPVGLAIVVQRQEKTGVALAVNGIFGNLGVASAALITAFLVDVSGWRSAFIVPGAVSIGIGILYLWFVKKNRPEPVIASAGATPADPPARFPKPMLARIFGIILFTTALGGLVFQSTTFSLPKLFDERLAEIAHSTTLVGSYAFLVFFVAAFAQLIVGHLVDNHSVRTVLAAVAFLQAVFLLAMTQVEGVVALFAATAFMLVVFGQVPVNDVLVGRIAHSEWRSRAYALRYLVTFSVMASALPLIAWIHGQWGFGRLYAVLAIAALAVFLAALRLPEREKLLNASSVA